MEKKQHRIDLKPENFHCIHCMRMGLYTGAEHLIWNEEEEVVYPVCSFHKDQILREKKFFSVFSIN